MARKKTTIYDIASSLNVSVATVYRALHNTGRISAVTKQRILDKAEEMHFKINQSAQGIRRDPVTIGILLCCPVASFLEEIQSGIEYEFNNLSDYNYYADIHTLPSVNTEECPEAVSEIFMKFKERKYGGVIAFLSGSSESVAPALKELETADIPMTCLVNDLCYKNRVAFIGADGYCAGRIAAELLSLSCRNQRIAILTGDSSIHIHKENLSGFMAEAGKDLFSCTDIYEHKDLPALVTQKLDEILTHEPRYQGLYITSASSITACSYLATHPMDCSMRIITTDLYYPIKEQLKKGTLCATIFQNPFLQGRKAVSSLYAYLQRQPVKDVVKIAPQIVMCSNIDMYYVRQPEDEKTQE